MKFTLPWLKEHLETEASLEAICERLTMLGLEVEGITDPARARAPSASPMSARHGRTRTPTGCSLCTVETRQGGVRGRLRGPNAHAG